MLQKTRRHLGSSLVALCLFCASGAFAQLERVGSVSLANGYPAWYQDTTGLALEFCSPTNTSELNGGWCVILPPDATAPENIDIAGKFFDEHFYFLAGAQGTIAPAFGGGKAKLVLALEGAFGGGAVLKGDQIVFARIRAVILDLPTGDYKVYHPYGTIGPIHVDATGNRAGKLFVTEDVGLACPPGQFDCALAGKIGPYLLPSATPGGIELPAVQNPADPGRLYIADPARVGPVTGAVAPNANSFRVVSVAGAIETDILGTAPGVAGPITDFSMAGRLFTGVIPGRVTVGRAVYSNDTAGKRVDVYASVFPTVQARVPGAGRPSEVTPQLGYYHGACNVDLFSQALSAPTGQASAPMRTAGHVSWGQTTPLAADPIPLQVCVEDKSSSSFYDANVTDEVKITQADYDPDAGTMNVSATSSDSDPSVELAVAFPGGRKTLQNGSAQNVLYATPPSRIQVTSNKRGTGQSKVTTKVLTSHTVLTDTLTAQNLIATVSVGTAVTIAVPNAAASGSTINIVTQGTSGIGTPKLDANGSAVGISYTANANTGGKTDTVSYTLASACTSSSSSCAVTTSNVATVTITITGAAAPAPAPGVVETITVTAASYRADQKRWTISGTDNVSNNQVLTIKNLGTIAAPKNDVIGTASVVAGAWTLDMRGVASVAVAGDRIVAVNISAGISSPERPMLSANIR